MHGPYCCPLEIFTSLLLMNGLSTVLCWVFIPEKSSHQSRVEAKTPSTQARQSRSFIHDIEWSIFWDVFLIRFFLSFSSLVYRSNFSLLIKENFGASPKVIGYLISFQVRILIIHFYRKKKKNRVSFSHESSDEFLTFTRGISKIMLIFFFSKCTSDFIFKKNCHN